MSEHYGTMPRRRGNRGGRNVQIISDMNSKAEAQLQPSWQRQSSQENGSTFTRSFFNPYESLKWRVAFSNDKGKFLTAEPFGYKLNVSGSVLKKRQMWIVVPDPLHEFVYLKSHLSRFLSADSDGVVTCSSEKPGLEERFTVEYSKSGEQWAFRSAQYSLYFSGEEDRLSCFSKTPVWWTCHLALHPQVHVKNLNRGRYLRLNGNEISADRVNPWGSESLITLQQVRGRVAIRTSDGKLLSNSGQIVDRVSESTLFCLEVRCGPNPGLAFRDSDGRYLTNIGATGTTRTKNSVVSKDELYVLEDSFPQISIKAFNGRYASVRQGHDINANQSEVSITETFQLEHHAGKWRIRTKDDKFWRLSGVGNGVTATGDVRDPSALFEMRYQQDGKVALKAANDYFLAAKKLGAINANSSQVRAEEQLQLQLLNRPVLVFRCDYGFVGIRNSRVECNLVNYDIFNLELSENGYHIRGPNGYWKVDPDSTITFVSRQPEEFVFEFHSRSCVAVRASNGCYIRGEQNGTVRVDAKEANSACLWEY